MREILRTQESQERVASLGAEVIDMDTRRFAAFEQGQKAKWAKVIKQANIRAE